MNLPSRESLEYVAAAGGAGAVFYSFWKWVWPVMTNFVKRTIALRDAVEAMPQTLQDIAYIKEQMTTLLGVSKRLQGMILPNGGSSLPDKMDRMGRELSALANLQKAAQNTNTRMATFEAGLDGRITDASKTYARWTGTQVEDLKNWGWVNTVDPRDVARVRSEYTSAVADQRSCTIDYAVIGHDGISTAVELTLTPVPDNGRPVESFFGSIMRVEDDDA